MALPLAVLTSRVRLEERLILQELRRRNQQFVQLDARSIPLFLDDGPLPYRGVLSREISHTRNAYLTRMFEHLGVQAVNPSRVIVTCGDKLLTTLALREAGLPTPKAMVTLTPLAALDHLDDLGYPVVVKPVIGSWGRLAAKLDNAQMAEPVLEHRAELTGPTSQVTFIQEYIDKPGRDIKAYVLGGEIVGAIYKVADHWRTNTARGGRPQVCPITPELERLLLATARAVGPGVLGIDVIERPDGSMVVNEVNHTPEFHGAVEVLEQDLVGAYVDYVLQELGEDQP